MLKYPRTVRKIAREIADAADGAFDSYREGEATEEPQVTDRILGAIQDRIRSQKIGGVTWSARTLRTGRGTAAEERRHGADILGVLDIDLKGYVTQKGFLAQAKKAEPDHTFPNREWNRLRRQCEIMLKRTSDSFVFVYSIQRGIRVVPANSVLGLDSRNIFDLYDRSFSSFFEGHIECFFGDPRLASTDINTLDSIADLQVNRVLKLYARMAK
ncbi:MAG: hypothetical protein OXI46_00050 [Gemmatimonadota bacterium]|nr:hypothetical protein [Gemmatimonadota bacterium]